MEEKLKVGYHLYVTKENNELTGLYHLKSTGGTIKSTPEKEQLKFLRILPSIMEELAEKNILDLSYKEKKFYACIQIPAKDSLVTKYQQKDEYFMNALVELEEKVAQDKKPVINLNQAKK